MKPGTTILVVEDDHDIAEAMIDVLVDQGYLVAHASNGREALDMLHEQLTPAVILLDLMMPEMDGTQFRAAQLKEPELASIPVVVISADRQVAQTARALGARDYAVKPLDPDRLVSLVSQSAS
jgi:CheY-like chemotaxis protein